ncbi:glycosyltransferase [Halobacteriales archaeon Cl-PHB]
MSSRARYLVGPLVVAAILALGFLSLFGDGLAGGPVLSLVLLAFDVRVLLGLAVLIYAVSFLLYLYYLRGEDRSRLVTDGPRVEAIVPVYRDADAMHQSVESLVASTYENLVVTIVPEPDDDPSLERAADLAASHDAVSVLVNDDRSGSKAGALNAAIEASDADVFALFDADQTVNPKLVAHAVAYLEDADVARVRSLPDPSGGWLESMVYYEYLLLFFLPQKLVKFLLGMEFAGTRSVLLNAEVYDEVGLYAEGHLAEDLDFTHEANQAGLSIRELLYYPSFEEPAHTLRDWWGQRIRWMSGQTEVGHDQLSDLRGLLDPAVLASLVTLVGTWIAGVLLALTVPKLALGLATSPLLVGTGLLGLYGVCLATRFVDNPAAGMTGFGLSWLLMPVAFTLFGLVILQVILEWALGLDSDWYSVDKQA